MASALAMFAASRGMQAGKGIADAYKQKVFSALQANALKNQINEIDKRASIEIGQILQSGREVVAEQTGAFIKGGVKIEGSAMDVLSDTMTDAAEAAYIRRREADYQIVGLEMQRASLKEASSDFNFLLNSLSAGAEAYVGYMGDEYMYNRGSLRDKGVKLYNSSYKPTGQYALNYTSSQAEGLG